MLMKIWLYIGLQKKNKMKYNKLVRDKIPEIIKRSGRNPLTHIADDTEFYEKLKLKLKEEVSEFLNNSNEEELVDILEVIDSICKFKKINKKDLQIIKEKKAEEKGLFDKRIILEED